MGRSDPAMTWQEIGTWGGGGEHHSWDHRGGEGEGPVTIHNSTSILTNGYLVLSPQVHCILYTDGTQKSKTCSVSPTPLKQ